jgi:Domain of unknown function (DUF3597)
VNVSLATLARLAKLGRDPGVVLPVKQCRKRQTTCSSHWERTMSIFGKIMGAIFGSKADAAPAGGGAAAGTASGGTAPSGGAASSGGAAAAPAATVEVAPILDKAVAAKGEKLAWRTSIVDLMKALDIDSSLTARKELAKELGYTGDTNDSASMNIWLHKQVMAKLAANGGKLPPDIKH